MEVFGPVQWCNTLDAKTQEEAAVYLLSVMVQRVSDTLMCRNLRGFHRPNKEEVNERSARRGGRRQPGITGTKSNWSSRRRTRWRTMWIRNKIGLFKCLITMNRCFRDTSTNGTLVWINLEGKENKNNG